SPSSAATRASPCPLVAASEAQLVWLVRDDSRVSGWSISVNRQIVARSRWIRARIGGASMTLADVTVLVTGANRGMGRVLVEGALRRGARKVYAGTRQPMAHPDERITPLALDVTSAAQIKAAAAQVESLDVLVNNAGVCLYDDLSDPAALDQHL